MVVLHLDKLVLEVVALLKQDYDLSHADIQLLASRDVLAAFFAMLRSEGSVWEASRVSHN